MSNRSYFVFLCICCLFLLSGCLKGEQTLGQLSVPEEDIKTENDEEDKNIDTSNEDIKKEEKKTEDVIETVARELYLFDASGLVASRTIELPKESSKAVAAQAIEYLVKDGPINDYLPNGFEAVLPIGTEVIGVNLKDDGTLIVDLSKEFQNYKKDEEVKILEAMTHTLTQFENVKQIKIWMNGQPLEKMPVNGTPISEGYSRSQGINILPTNATGQVRSESVTMYYPKEYNDQRYYIPVTKHVATNRSNFYEEMIRELLEGPGYETNVIDVFNWDTELTKTPELTNGVLQLEFTDSILKDKTTGVIADEVIETIVRSLTARDGIEAVQIEVENTKDLMNENGERYNHPVSKYKYKPKEKL